MTDHVLPAPDRCEECGVSSSVIEVREHGGQRWRSRWIVRRRECEACGTRWNTWESSVFHPVRVCRELRSRTDIADPEAVLRDLIGPSRPREE
jgi:transcriptional regulator NrdR family protein